MAHKKGLGASRNGRDSNPQFLGVKKYSGEFVTGGTIIVKQRGTPVHPGTNTGRSGDDSIFAKIDGKVQFRKGKAGRKFVSVIPQEVKTA
ncbi:MAG: 50S ribosomal protein L27 [bacterium]